MALIDKLGSDEGKQRGPAPGEGGSIAGQAGNSDIEGTPNDALPDYRGQANKPTTDGQREDPARRTGVDDKRDPGPANA